MFWLNKIKILAEKKTSPEVKNIFLLNSAHKYKNIQKFGFFLDSDKPRTSCIPLINVKMPTIVGILTFMSRTNFILS